MAARVDAPRSFPFPLFELNSLPETHSIRGQDMNPFRQYQRSASQNTDSLHVARAIHVPIFRASLREHSFLGNGVVQMRVTKEHRRALSALLLFIFISTVCCQTLEPGNTAPSLFKESRTLLQTRHFPVHKAHTSLLFASPAVRVQNRVFFVRMTESLMAVRRESLYAF